ncbi:MAG TPA: baseplate J/gp47 family protein [Acidimicrobiales bacterium]
MTSLPSPNLDDRDFADLVAEATRVVRASCPGWTDLTPGDPGIVLLELFAHLTDVLLYRLNQVPEKVYVELLKLLGVRLAPPAAAGTTLVFSRQGQGGQPGPIRIPAGTRVGTGRPDGGGEVPVFVTVADAVLEPAATEVEVRARHCDVVDAELAGRGTGLPGQVVRAARPPLVVAEDDGTDLVVGVEATADELSGRAAAREHDGRAYRLWREVQSFADVGDDRFVYVVDRVAGTVTFAPAARLQARPGEPGAEPADLAGVPGPLAEVPAAGREIRLWYRRGGGPSGNVAGGTLTQLRSAVPGVTVTNRAPAIGGRAVETVENALVRGPQELHTPRRAVTARDVEALAVGSAAGVARAAAFTRAELWRHAAPGSVEVTIVPAAGPPDGAAAVDLPALRAAETADAAGRVRATLDERRPLGVDMVVRWANYKQVRVSARVVVHRSEDPEAVRARLDHRLREAVNPLPSPGNPLGWRFGQPLRASHVYDVVLKEPGVRFADEVRLLVDEVPLTVRSLAADAFQPSTWFAASGETVFRSLDDGRGWEPAGRFAGETAEVVRTSPQRPGLVAAAVRVGGGEESAVYLSGDLGETWSAAGRFGYHVEDLCWLLRDGQPVVLLATDRGLFELAPGGTPVQVLVDAADPDLGCYSVVAALDVRDELTVAVAAQDERGVYLSSRGGRPGTFRKVGLAGTDVRRLAVQTVGPTRFLWAGVTVPGDEPGSGALRWELRGAEDPPEGWVPMSQGWVGGSCHDLAFLDTTALAASHTAGVLRLDASAERPSWTASDVASRLPLRDTGRFHPVDAVATSHRAGLVMAGGPAGANRSTDGGATYEPTSERVFREAVTLPPTWLFVSGPHELTVVGEDAAG